MHLQTGQTLPLSEEGFKALLVWIRESPDTQFWNWQNTVKIWGLAAGYFLDDPQDRNREWVRAFWRDPAAIMEAGVLRQIGPADRKRPVLVAMRQLLEDAGIIDADGDQLLDVSRAAQCDEPDAKPGELFKRRYTEHMQRIVGADFTARWPGNDGSASITAEIFFRGYLSNPGLPQRERTLAATAALAVLNPASVAASRWAFRPDLFLEQSGTGLEGIYLFAAEAGYSTEDAFLDCERAEKSLSMLTDKDIAAQRARLLRILTQQDAERKNGDDAGYAISAIDPRSPLHQK